VTAQCDRAGRVTRVASVLALVVGAILVVASGAQAAAAVSVTPATGLTDQQVVTVTFSGFTPDKTINIRQCLPAPESGDDCDFLSTANPRTDASGAGTFQYTVYVLPNDILPGPVLCDAATSCVVTVSDDLNDFSEPNASVPISFGAGSVAATTTTVAPSATTTTVANTTTSTQLATTTTSVTGPTTTTAVGATTTTLAGATSTTLSGSATAPTTTTLPGATTTSSTTLIGSAPTTIAAGSLSLDDESGGTLSLTGAGSVLSLLTLLGVSTVAGGTLVRARASGPLPGWRAGINAGRQVLRASFTGRRTPW